MSDHGDRHGQLRKTALGWYEDKLPSMWVYLSPDLIEKFPDWYSALKVNSRRLSSPFDLYHTMMQILESYDYRKLYEQLLGTVTRSRRGQTFFKPISENRTCRDAGIPASFCACTKPKEIIDLETERFTLNKIGLFVVNYLRKILPQACSMPALKKIVAAKRIDSFESETVYYVTLYTDPGDFLFEATVKVLKNDVDGKVNYSMDGLGDILRMNKIIRKVDCVDSHQLERYCYCS